ncbi:Uncharacterised protein [Zhongshania aliphaticivorans]|uniref:DUF2894 domain-containing protein n=1 Tax=Zhongshania aliphaticivorans TaxID=1470434 RepID=A0A5S9PZD0_9GAMM|nr:DUF2894 domain-containing protein [Zhongshania aliphaticivorans]CAA0110387.1 Uncharacterised protein [Zhongshania aliphaticivorans]CAA0118114.1 Uncharacterised protein [Zhongshania aliphaticivorans]CAA0122067.1 Uncharacterised protein [Zhongshania aliphaticivorans]
MLVELRQELMNMREANAHCFSPARFRYLESMLGRAERARKPVQVFLEQKALDALQRYRTDYEAEAKKALGCLSESKLAQGEALFHAGHYHEVSMLLSGQGVRLTPERTQTVTALRELQAILNNKQAELDSPASSTLERQLRVQEAQSLTDGLYSQSLAQDEDGDDAATGRRSLQSIQTMQVSQQRRELQRRVELAIQEGPDSPGPLNPQMLAIKALTAMRDISPQYLSRYVNYLDALFWLEQAVARPAPAKPAKKPRKSSKKK